MRKLPLECLTLNYKYARPVSMHPQIITDFPEDHPQIFQALSSVSLSLKCLEAEHRSSQGLSLEMLDDAPLSRVSSSKDKQTDALSLQYRAGLLPALSRQKVLTFALTVKTLNKYLFLYQGRRDKIISQDLFQL